MLKLFFLSFSLLASFSLFAQCPGSWLLNIEKADRISLLTTGASVTTNGNFYFSGNFEDTIKAGDKSVIGTGAQNQWDDILLAKTSAAGNVDWMIQSRDQPQIALRSQAVLSNGNVIISGNTNAAKIYLKDDSVSSGTDQFLFLASITESGDIEYIKPLISYNNPSVLFSFYQLTVDGDDNIYLSGSMYGTMHMDTVQVVTPALSAFVAKFDKHGNYLWHNIIGSSEGNIVSYSLMRAEDGNIYSSYDYRGKLYINNDTIPNKTIAGGSDYLLTKTDAAGNLIWYKTVSGIGTEEFRFSAGDESGNVYGILDGGGNLYWGDSLLAAVPGRPKIAAIDNLGNLMWYRSFVASKDFRIGDIHLIGNNRLLVSGSFDTLTIDNQEDLTSSSTHEPNGFLMILSNSGQVEYFKQIKSTGNSTAGTIQTDGMENIYVYGNFRDEVKFDAHEIVNQGKYGSYVLKTCLDEITGIGKSSKNPAFAIKIYPNPVKNQVVIELPEDRLSQLFIYNTTGSCLYKATAPELANPQLHVDVTNLKTGTYIIKAVGEKSIYYSKFIKN